MWISTTLLFIALHDAAISDNSAPERLSGHWCQKSEQRITEEVWLPAVTDKMHGVNRSIGLKDNRVFFEWLRMEKRAGRWYFYAQPSGALETSFAQVLNENHPSGESGALVFTNEQHDFPTRIQYQLISANALVMTVDAPGKSEKVLRWQMTRLADSESCLPSP